MLNTHLLAAGYILHFVGITCFTGGCLTHLFIGTQLWKQLKEAPYRAVIFLPMLKWLPFFIQMGSLLMLFSGLLMMDSMDALIWDQPWFIMKMILYIFLNVNCYFVARPTTEKLFYLLPNLFETDPNVNHELGRLRGRMQWFNVSQLMMTMMIFIVSQYRI